MGVPVRGMHVPVLLDEDVSEPQTADGYRWLHTGEPTALSPAALAVLADVVAELTYMQDTCDDPREFAHALRHRLGVLYANLPNDHTHLRAL